MIFVWAILGSLVATLLFDFVYFKIEEKWELEASWRALNEMLESEGKPRWDQMDRDNKEK